MSTLTALLDLLRDRPLALTLTEPDPARATLSTVILSDGLDSVPVTDQPTTVLAALVALGAVAQSALDVLDRQADEHAEAAAQRAAQHARAQLTAQWSQWAPTGLPVAAADGALRLWRPTDDLTGRAPDADQTGDDLWQRRHDGPAVLTFGRSTLRDWQLLVDVTSPDGTRTATVAVTSSDGQGELVLHRPFTGVLRTYGRGALSKDQAAALSARCPWPARPYDLSGPATPAGLEALLTALLADADAAGDWVRDVTLAHAAAQTAEQEAEEALADLAKAWRKASRSPRRIPTAALNKWLEQRSHIDYTRTGMPSSGWRAVAVPLVAEQRPAALEPAGRGRRSRDPLPGVRELLYVIRIEHHDAVRRRTRADYHSFYESDIAALRAALPGCVVKVPEDKKVLFVAFDSPEYVAELDGALAEWVLLGGEATG